MHTSRLSALAATLILAGLAAAPAATFAHGEGDQMDMQNMPGMQGMHAHHMMMMDHKAGIMRSSASYQVPDVKLVDTSGKEVSLRAALDSDGPVMLNFIFTTCSTICPMLTATFSQVQSQLDAAGEPVKLVSISIDPENDTPAKLREYAQKYHAGPNWKMLTGSLESSIAVQRAFDAYRGDKMNHEPVTYMRPGKGKPWVRLDGLASAGDLMKEYRQMVASK